MALIRCQNGHMFSERRYGTVCPYCNIQTSVTKRVAEPMQEQQQQQQEVEMDGDNYIANRNHAIIVYDAKKKNNVLLPGDSSGIAYLNGEPIYMPSELSAYDVIDLGKSKFLFVPFCGEHFEWEEN